MMNVPVGAQKRSYVRRMFGRIAGRYDLMNRLMTFGQDQGWRRLVVDLAAPTAAGIGLDVGTGTGDLAIALAGRMGRVIGLDFASEMMAIGQTKATAAANPVRFVSGDALELPFPDDSFDCVVSGFAVRNLTDILAGFMEMARVTKPGGRVVCLEVSETTSPVVSALHHLYFRQVVPILGQLLTGNGEAYRYLPSSAAQFPSRERIKALMEEAGLHEVTHRGVTFGVAAIHAGVK